MVAGEIRPCSGGRLDLPNRQLRISIPGGVRLPVFGHGRKLGVLLDDRGIGVESVDDHIEQDAQPQMVGLSNQCTEIRRAAVRRVDGVKIEGRIITLPMGHEIEGVDSQVEIKGQPCGNFFEPAREIFGVNLQDDRILYPGRWVGWREASLRQLIGVFSYCRVQC